MTRHFLLLTATPHNGADEDFQLFMALLDGHRFEGRFRDGVHAVDTPDLMCRLVKEQLLTFEGTPLFPKRLAATISYRLSAPEARLYTPVSPIMCGMSGFTDLMSRVLGGSRDDTSRLHQRHGRAHCSGL